MTAEIVVMNLEAVALAADSAVTMRGGAVEKTSTSANKLFALSSRHPVGIMLYGNALFMGLPWETIIKVYRSTSLPSSGFATLKEYAEDFISFLRYDNIWLPDVAEDHYIFNFVESVIDEIRQEVLKRITAAIREYGEFDESMPSQVAEEVIRGRIESYQAGISHINP